MLARDTASIVLAGVVVLSAIAGLVYSKVTGKDDSYVEEVAEELIYEYTGVDLDLTPSSEEGIEEEEQGK